MDYRSDSPRHIIFAMTACGYPSTLDALGMFISISELPELTQRFLYDQLLSPELAD